MFVEILVVQTKNELKPTNICDFRVYYHLQRPNCDKF